MEGAALAIASATLLLLAASILGPAAFRPRLSVYFPDGDRAAQYPGKTQQTLSLHVKNRGGWFGLPTSTVDNIWVTLYLPNEFDLQSGEYMHMGGKQTTATPAAQDGRFRGTKYIIAGRFSLFTREVDVVQFTFTTPAQTGQYKAYVAVLSERGHGGVHNLSFTIV